MPRVKKKEVKLQSISSLEVLYEDDVLIAVHKPAWYLVHPSPEARDAPDILSLLDQNVAPIHRLDRQTSGVLLLSKDPLLTRELQALWATENVNKKYLTYVYGHPPEKFESTRPLTDAKSGQKKSAHSIFWTRERFEKGALIEAQIFTGRRHQIRRHLSHMGHHILGDRMYGKGRMNAWAKEQGLTRLFLHAHDLSFWHPYYKKKVELKCPLPKELLSFLSQR